MIEDHNKRKNGGILSKRKIYEKISDFYIGVLYSNADFDLGSPSIKGIIFNTFFILGLVAFLNYDFMVVLEKSIRGKQEKISLKKIVLSSTRIILEVFLVLSYIVYFVLVDIFKEYILMLTIILIFSMALLGFIAYVISKKFRDS